MCRKHKPSLHFPASASEKTEARQKVIAGLDITIVHESASGIYFGEPRGIIAAISLFDRISSRLNLPALAI